MPQARLTKSTVEKIRPEASDVFVWDQALPGFGIRVKPTGVRSYVVQYRNRETGVSRRKTLGRHGPLLSFDQAKRQARAILADAMRGADPVAEAVAARKAPTVDDLCDDYLSRHAIPNKRPNSIRGDRSLIDRFIRPALGRRRVEQVTRRDIEDLRERCAATPYQANRLLALVSKMFALAEAWGWRTGNPAKGVARYQERKRDRWLKRAELQRLLQALERHPNRIASGAIQLQMSNGIETGPPIGLQKGPPSEALTRQP